MRRRRVTNYIVLLINGCGFDEAKGNGALKPGTCIEGIRNHLMKIAGVATWQTAKGEGTSTEVVVLKVLHIRAAKCLVALDGPEKGLCFAGRSLPTADFCIGLFCIGLFCITQFRRFCLML